MRDSEREYLCAYSQATGLLQRKADRLAAGQGEIVIRPYSYKCAWVIVGCILVALSVSNATAQSKIPRIGYLSAGSALPGAQWPLDSVLEGLHELGYVEGKNIHVESRYADGKLERLPALARELATFNIDVMHVAGDQGIVAAKQASDSIPIVALTCDPPDSMKGHLARPGGKVTGVTCVAADLAGKRVQLLREIAPKRTRFAVIYNSLDPNKLDELKELKLVLRSLGLNLSPYEVHDAAKFPDVFAAMKKDKAGALLILDDLFTAVHVQNIATLALQYRMPSMYGFSEYAAAGGLVTYGTDLRQMYKRTAYYIDKILKGTGPGQLPIEQPTRFDLVVNLKTAKALGITIPQSILLRADRVIE